MATGCCLGEPKTLSKRKRETFRILCKCVTFFMCDYPLRLQIYSCYRNIYIYTHIFICIYIYIYIYIYFQKSSSLPSRNKSSHQTAKKLWSSIVICIFKLIINSMLSLMRVMFWTVLLPSFLYLLGLQIHSVPFISYMFVNVIILKLKTVSIVWQPPVQAKTKMQQLNTSYFPK